MHKMPSTEFKRLERVLVTNDDGIDAPGLSIAEEVAGCIANEVWTVAPHSDCSGGSRQINLHKPLRIIRHGKNRYSVTGSPADCVMVGAGEVLKDKKIDLVVSGVNAGVNIGGDVGFSGTVGAAMNIPWETSKEWLPGILKILIGNQNWPWGFVPNINVPAVSSGEVEGISVSQQGQTTRVSPLIEKRTDLRQQEYMWLYLSKDHGQPDNDEDISVLRSNRVSVTFLTRNITDQGITKELSSLFAK
jgi:5'-nucleotidase